MGDVGVGVGVGVQGALRERAWGEVLRASRRMQRAARRAAYRYGVDEEDLLSSWRVDLVEHRSGYDPDRVTGAPDSVRWWAWARSRLRLAAIRALRARVGPDERSDRRARRQGWALGATLRGQLGASADPDGSADPTDQLVARLDLDRIRAADPSVERAIERAIEVGRAC